MDKVPEEIIPTNTYSDVKNREYFSLLYDTYAPALYGIICKFALDKAIADEVLVETFYQIWATYNTFEPTKCTLLIWATRITVQQCKKVFSLSNQTFYNLLLPKKLAVVI